MLARGMYWRAEPADQPTPPDRLAQQILRGLAQPGVHRAMFDPHSWTLLKWLDAPCPFYDWRRIAADSPRIHPDDEAKRAAMRTEFTDGAACAVLRLPAIEPPTVRSNSSRCRTIRPPCWAVRRMKPPTWTTPLRRARTWPSTAISPISL